MNDRLLSFLGLCKRAGQLISGADTVVRTMKDNKALLVLAANDFSDNSLKNVEKASVQYQIPLRTLPRSKEELSFALGKHCGVVCITDKGFADKILTMIDT
jgi:ribosomal protein L7Ae-like RNA K-turn-binding protein